MFNPNQFKAKKKGKVSDIPRPNLMTHEKKLKEQTEAFDKMVNLIERQQSTIEKLQRKYENMQQSIDQILNYLRKGR